MTLTADQLDRACGFLFLNDFDAFIYCCKCCLCEFQFSSDLEEHILSEHQNTKMGIESVYVSDGVLDSILAGSTSGIDQELMGIDDIKQKIEVKPTEFQYNVESPANDFLGVFINDNNGHGMLKNEVVPSELEELMTVKPNAQPTLTSRIKANTTTKAVNKSRKVANTKKKTPWFDMTKYYCDMCPFDKVKFTQKKKLVQHLRDHVSVFKNCPICHESVQYLNKHLKARHPDDAAAPYKCTFCSRRFDMEGRLAMHTRTHTNERPFQCDQCGSAFKTNNALKVHIDRIHMNANPKYTCDQCDLSFFYVSQYESHRFLRHSDDRPHVCNICGDRFKATNTLRIHKFKHAAPSFACRYCGKLFKARPVKRFHERKVHEEVNWGKKKK